MKQNTIKLNALLQLCALELIPTTLLAKLRRICIRKLSVSLYVFVGGLSFCATMRWWWERYSAAEEDYFISAKVFAACFPPYRFSRVCASINSSFLFKRFTEWGETQGKRDARRDSFEQNKRRKYVLTMAHGLVCFQHSIRFDTFCCSRESSGLSWHNIHRNS